MRYDFDQIIDRKNTNSVKYDFAAERGKPEGLLPLWVADMDFQAPPEVIDALHKVAAHGIFGYSDAKPDYFQALAAWYADRFDWQIKKDWLLRAPGVVFTLCTAVRALTFPGDAVLIQRPVYYPFSRAILNTGRNLVNSPLILRDGRYEMDIADFEQKIVDHKVKLFILCSPHNPVGRVWTEEELRQIGDICLKYDVTVVADEIHADFVYPGHHHRVFSNLRPEFAAITVTCTAPSKTFNLAGLQGSNILISNPVLRKKLKNEIARTGYGELNIMALSACQAAYTHGGPWLEALKAYLGENLVCVRNFLAAHLPRVKLIEPEGTYLIWLDFSALNLDEAGLEERIADAGLWLDGGTTFGPEGLGFQRVNIACPRQTLEKALRQLARAIDGR